MGEVVFGRYRLLSLLGEGGMGEVWRARDTVIDRVIAIKLLPPVFSKDQDFQRRFRREAHAAARLETPHVVPIYDYGEIDGQLFVSMRLIKGRDLSAVLAEGPLEPVRAVHIINQVAEALHAAHEIGLIHRDIKPSNILLDDRDFAYLIDFGIARAADDTRLTKTGNTIGTFAYIAPERLNGRAEDARADIYSLACVLYESLTGHPPFAGDNMGRLVAAHLTAPPPRPSADKPNVPVAVDEVIAIGMAKDPDRRYATTIEFADAAGKAITVPVPRLAASPAFMAATEPLGKLVTGEPTLAATREGGSSASQLRPADQAPPAETLTPTPQRWAALQSRRARFQLIAAIVLILAVGIGIILYGIRQPTTASRPSATATTAAPTTAPTGPPPVAQSALHGLLLTPDQINTAMGATAMRTVADYETLSDPTDQVSPPECSPAFYGTVKTVYPDGGYTAVREEQLSDSGTNPDSGTQHLVIQGVVLFSSAHAADAVFRASPQNWSACANRSFTANGIGWTAGPLSSTDGTLTASFSRNNSNDGWTCQRASTVKNNVVVETKACSRNITDQAVNIADHVAAKVPT